MLASDAGADLVIVDEAPARKRAAALGLPLTGTVGVLIRAKTEGELEAVRPVLDHLRRTSLWISDGLYRKALRAVNEVPAR